MAITIDAMPQNVPFRNPASEQVDVLRSVPDEKAFHFYNGMDSPLGVKANSLVDLLDILIRISPASIEFHSRRDDFGKWIVMLGDATLAKQILTLERKGLRPPQLKNQLIGVVRLRLGKLQKSRK